MRVAIFGVKYNESLTQFRNDVKGITRKRRIQVDDSYFTSSTSEDKLNPDKLYKHLTKSLLLADLVIVENTDYSNGIGFIIGKAAEMKRPVLVLFKEGEETSPSIVIKAFQSSKRFEYSTYTKENLQSVLDEHLVRVKKLLNTKYLLNLTPEMSRYLQWSSDKDKRPMVEILHELIMNRIGNDEEWIRYSAEQK